mgnify:FL=1
MQKPPTHRLYIRDFFEHFDPGDPHQLGSLSELQDAIDKADRSILRSDADWYVTWKWGGKRREPSRLISEK